MSVHALIRLLLLLSVTLLGSSCYMSGRLPLPAKLAPLMLEEPEQKPTKDRAFGARVEGVDYQIEPRYTYDIAGLVVETHDSDSWWDYAHREWNDHVNVADLCVVWGGNVRNDAYRRVSYGHTQWECSWSTRDPNHGFDPTAFSNNHVVTDDTALGRRLKDVRVGDEVRIKGYLVDYATFTGGRQTGIRKTSTVRTDDGDGACEVIWVRDFEIVKSHNRAWRLAGKIGAGLLALSLIAWILAPAKLDD